MLKFYEYSKCGTCRSALKYLDSLGISYTRFPVREVVPDFGEISRMLAAYDGDIRKLFNTSGQTYRELDVKNKLPSMSESEAIELLRSNGNLIKRPFVIGDAIAVVGFNKQIWDRIFNN